MNYLISQFLPIILFFAAGIIFKKSGLANNKNADFLLKLVFYFTLPALIITYLLKTKISSELILLPVIAALTALFSFILSIGLNFILKKENSISGVNITGTMIMNLGFTYPFILLGFKEQGFAYAAVFDAGNLTVTYSFAYYIACIYGKSNNKVALFAIKKILKSAPIWAVSTAIFMNIANIKIPSLISPFLNSAGQLTIPLLLFSLGVYFSPKIINLSSLLSVISIRMIGGPLITYLLTTLLGIQGLVQAVIITCSAAPVGYNTLIFSTITKLDNKYAASLVSISALIGFIYLPVLMFFLNRF